MIYRYETSEDVAKAAAKRITELAIEAIHNDDIFHWVLSGGSTPKIVFREIAESGKWSKEMISKTHIWWGDERSVPNDHQDSNVKMAYDNFISAMKFPAENIHAPNGGTASLSDEATRYENEIKKSVSRGNTDLPCFHLVMLGMGDDGHTASLFPGTQALNIHDRLFVENAVPQLKTDRLTMTYPLLNAAEDLMLLVTGAKKRPILEQIFGKTSPGYPIEKITGNKENVHWYCDESAMPE